MLMAMAASVLVARSLGPELRGQYGMILMAVSMIAAFGHLGIGAAISYHTGRKTHPSSEILSFLVAGSLLLGIALSALFVAFYRDIPGIWTDISLGLMILGMTAVPFTFLHNFLQRFLLGMLRVRQSNISKLLQTTLYIALVAGVILLGRSGVPGVVFAYSASIILAAVISLFLYTKDIRPFGRLRPSLLGPFVTYGFQVYLIFVFNFLNHRFDIILIKHFLTASDVSFYQIPVNLCERLWQIPNSMAAVLFPTLLALDRGTAEFTARISRSNFTLMVALAIVFVIGAALFLPLLYGQEYLPMLPALYSVIWGIVISPVATFIGVYFASRRQVWRNIVASAAGFLCNLVLNVIMIPRIGIVGAGIATSISNTLWALILAVFFVRQEDVRMRDLFIVTREDVAGLWSGIRRGDLFRRGTDQGAGPDDLDIG